MDATRSVLTRRLATAALWITCAYGAAVPAATFYVDASASNDHGDGSASRPKKYLSSGIELLSTHGGDTLIIRRGTYADRHDAIGSVPSGRAAAYNVIKAAEDGTVLIKAELVLTRGDHYTQFEGLKWDSPTIKGVQGRYVKFLRCAFKGGPGSGNTMNLAIGTNDVTPGADYVLIEDSWVYGSGGRYKLLVYNADHIILRRVVVRHDGGWRYDFDNPQGGIVTYNSRNIRLQDVIVVDSLPDLPGFESNIYLVGNTSSATRPDNVKISGAIVIGGGGNGIALDDSVPYANTQIEDSVIWGTTAGFSAHGAAHVATVNRVLVHSGHTAFADWAARHGITVKNSIAYRNAGAALTDVTGSHIVSYGNGADSGTILDPLANGLTYLPRIEPGSMLAHMGDGGGQVGPEIQKRIGRSGTLYGDPGFEELGSEDLWPWPYEARLKADFAELPARGFTAQPGTLTDYIWSMLGHPSPWAVRP
jgi:hypothetical protein